LRKRADNVAIAKDVADRRSPSFPRKKNSTPTVWDNAMQTDRQAWLAQRRPRSISASSRSVLAANLSQCPLEGRYARALRARLVLRDDFNAPGFALYLCPDCHIGSTPAPGMAREAEAG
jgi:hypothetical protein